MTDGPRTERTPDGPAQSRAPERSHARGDRAAGDAGPRRPDFSMGLLTEVVTRALDPGYAEAARRGPVARTPAARAGRTGLHLVLAIALGLTTVMAIVQLRAPSADGPSPRALLEREITDRSTQAESLARTVENISAEIADLQAEALEQANPGLLDRLREAELVSGAVAVAGPGLVIVLEDAPDADAADEAARVQDVDLQIVTNALWAAGAEAIAINGQRLTALTAIRSAGSAILIDPVPLLGPYRVEAIGDVRTMQTAFARSTAANHLAFLSGTYGIRTTTTAEPELQLPGRGDVTLRHATAGPDVASSSTAREEDSS